MAAESVHRAVLIVQNALTGFAKQVILFFLFYIC